MSTIDTFDKGLGGASSVTGPGASAIASNIFAAFENLVRRMQHASEVARSRRSLANLSDHQLRDIGITRHQATIEANRSFWR